MKRIISSLTSGRPGSEAAALIFGVRSTDGQTAASTPTISDRSIVDEPQDDQALSILSATQRDEDRGPDFQAHKTAFFFKLERELEKVAFFAFCTRNYADLRLR